MSDNLLEKQLEDARAELAAAKAENDAIKAQIEEAKDKEFASKVEAFEAEVQQKDSSIAELEESIKSTQARVAELEDALAKSQEDLASAKEHMEEMKKKEKMEKRKAALVEAGFDVDDVDAALAAFDGLADEAFDSVVAMYGKKEKAKKEAEAGMPPEVKEAIEKKKKEKEAKADEEEAEAEVTPELLEDVQTSEATLVEAAPEVDEVESTRASISDWLENNVLKNK
jgi:chromosome segregation ATPase